MAERLSYCPENWNASSDACLEKIRAVMLTRDHAEFNAVSVNKFFIRRADADSVFESHVSVSVRRLFSAHCLADYFDIRVIHDDVNVVDDSGNITNVENVFDVKIIAEDVPDFGLILLDDFSDSASDCSES